MESLQPSEPHALLGVFADEKWDSDFEALLQPALKEQLRPEALRSKLDWTKPVRVTHGIMLLEQWKADNIRQSIPLQKCDLELHIAHTLQEGMARVMSYICISSPFDSKLSLYLAIDNSKCDRLKSLLCR